MLEVVCAIICCLLSFCARDKKRREMAENGVIAKSKPVDQRSDAAVTADAVVATVVAKVASAPVVEQPEQQQQQSVATTQASERKFDSSSAATSDTAFNSQRVFKKSSPNSKLTLYLASRDLIVSGGKIDKLQGVLLVDPEYLQDKKVYGQVTLTFRYGREDEEVMGLKFCNEAVMCLAQLYPPYPGADHQEATTMLQEALIKRLGSNAHPFTMEVTPLAPPSVQLVPAKEYNGAPIGTSYDVRAYVEPSAPHAVVEKPFLLSDGRVGLEARLDRAIYSHGDPILVHVHVTNNSNKSVRRIKVFVVQHVDVCMFSNGKFKNVVALVSSQDGCPVGPGATLTKSYTLRPVKGSTKNWIALEDSYSKSGATLASTVVCTGSGPEDRNVFAIYVSYYVKVKLLISAIGGEVSLKLPFTLMHSNNDPDLIGFPSPIRETPKTPEGTRENLNRKEEKALPEVGNPAEEKLDESERVKENQMRTDVPDVDLIEHCDEGGST